jgi:hypothetical protein
MWTVSKGDMVTLASHGIAKRRVGWRDRARG